MEPIFVYSFALLFYATLKTAEEHRLAFYLGEIRSKSLEDLISHTAIQHNGTRLDGVRSSSTAALLLR